MKKRIVCKDSAKISNKTYIPQKLQGEKLVQKRVLQRIDECTIENTRD